MNLSKVGIAMTHLTGVRAIMKDIEETLRKGGESIKFYNFGAGNPVILPEVEQLWKECTEKLMATSEYSDVVGKHGSSRGYEPLIDAIVKDFNNKYNLKLTEQNILITLGSQSLYFYAANMFGGYTSNGTLKKIALPLSPDYTGYGGISFTEESLVACKPIIEFLSNNRFKYHPDLNNLSINEDTGMVLFSRPSNPTGNVLSEEEVHQITEKAALHDVPVFVDSAYGPPYPGLNFKEIELVFKKNIIHCMSLSKVGLPGERIGIAIGDKEVIKALETCQEKVLNYSSQYGQAIATHAINSGKLEKISNEVIRPYYQNKKELMEAIIQNVLPKDIPWFLHQCEGAMFSWLWFQDLPITDWELYHQLKSSGVIAVPGSPFFYGLEEEWDHRKQCLRLSFTASDGDIREGILRLSEVIKRIYSKH